MVPAAYLLCCSNQPLVLIGGEIFKHLRAYQRVGFHNLKLFLSEPSGLVEDFFVYRNLSYIMKRGGKADKRYIRLSKPVFIGDLLKLAKHDIGEGADMYYVLTAFAVSELYYMA